MDGKMKIYIIESCRGRDSGNASQWFNNGGIYTVHKDLALAFFAAGKAVKWPWEEKHSGFRT